MNRWVTVVLAFVVIMLFRQLFLSGLDIIEDRILQESEVKQGEDL